MTSDDLTHSSAEAGDMGSRDGFEIEVRRPSPNVILLRLQGAVDMWTSFTLMESIIEAFAEHPALIAVDLSDVRSIDDAGVRVLVDGARPIEDGRVRFAVICPPDHKLAAQLSGLGRALHVHESAYDALEPWLDNEEEIPAGV